MIVALTSQYDVFLARLMDVLLRKKPEMLAASERKFTFSEINSYSSIEDIRSDLIEAEIDSLLRKSVVEQFVWMENKFDVKLRTDLEIWASFVELSQRRNLFVHADGLVSRQYLAVCSDQGSDISKIKIGDELSVDAAYYRRAHRILLEIAVKLSQVLWRKLDAASLDEAEKHLNVITYNLLRQEKYDIACELLDFAFSKMMRRSSKECELMLLINRANAYRLNGNPDRCAKLLGDDDWSAYAPQFQLARAVLKEEEAESLKLMKKIGKSGPPELHDYREWPLFKTMRESARFQETFIEIFDEPLNGSQGAELEEKLSKEIAMMPTPDFKDAFASSFGGEMAGWLDEFMKQVLGSSARMSVELQCDPPKKPPTASRLEDQVDAQKVSCEQT